MRSLRHHATYLAVAVLAAGAVVAPARGGIGPVVDTAVVASPGTIRAAKHRTGYTIVKTPEGVGCRDATLEEMEASETAKRANAEPLHVIKGERANKTSAGLTIVLRATNQLENFPNAKNAFIRAANEWESRISSAITVVVDVDFGPKNFGTTFGTDVIGSTNPQSLVGDGLYSSVRSSLLSHASSASETALYATLPSSSVPTDNGAISTMTATSANLRALGLINAVANPTNETNFGDPPAVGFNSVFSYDFDASNGVDFDKTDFNAVVLHELGHVLGFDSDAGFKELYPRDDVALTPLDLFRFRPGTTSSTFGSASRILSSGGTQVFYGGGSELGLSTGRPDGTGGDGQQASHWKDDEQSGTHIGLMDPTIADGQHEDITAGDLLAFDTIGYRFAAAPTISIGNLFGNLVGTTLTITGTGQSSSAISLAEVTLLDIQGNELADLPDTPLSIGTSGSFTLTFDNLDDVPAATAARVTLRDGAGNVSAGTVADFSGYETGAPVATKVKIKGLKLKLTGTGFSSSMQLEVNGQISALPAGSTVKPTGLKATVNLASVTLRSGANRIRFILNGKHSNIVVLTHS